MHYVRVNSVIDAKCVSKIRNTQKKEKWNICAIFTAIKTHRECRGKAPLILRPRYYSVITQFANLASGEQLCRRCTHRKLYRFKTFKNISWKITDFELWHPCRKWEAYILSRMWISLLPAFMFIALSTPRNSYRMFDTSYTPKKSPLVVHLQLFSCYSVCGFRCTVYELMDYKQNTNVFWKSDIRLNWRDVNSSKDYCRVFRF